MYITYKKGQEAVLAVQRRALQRDCVICFPTTESRFDAVVVTPDGKCLKAQIKYADQENKSAQGSIVLDLRKETRNDGKKKTYSDKEIDILLVYLPVVDEVLWFGPEQFGGKQSLTIRYEPPKNGYVTNVTLHKNFIW